MTEPHAPGSAPCASSVYVYYRLRDDARARAAHVTGELQAGVAARIGVRGRLLVKRGEPLLWMEIYEGVADVQGLLDALAAEAMRLQFDALLQPGKARAVEVFIPMACA